jgi:YHS domain-containing protein
MNLNFRNLITMLFAGALVLTMVSITGCKEKSEPGEIPEAESIAAEAIEQTRCPVMDGAINKELYAEYKGKKVYFCCPGCEEKFLEEPEKYIAKLPQFSN